MPQTLISTNQSLSPFFQQNIELECKLYTTAIASQMLLITTTMYGDPTNRFKL
jgi:hypothetical protein